MIPHPLLPPRMPVATPAAIRQYIVAPPDYAKLKTGERVEEEHLSDDQKLMLAKATAELQAKAAEDQRAAAEMQARTEMRKKMGQLQSSESPTQQPTRQPPQSESVASDEPAPVVADEQPPFETEAASTPATSSEPTASPSTLPPSPLPVSTLTEIARLKDKLQIPKERWLALMKGNFSVQSAKELTAEQAEKLLEALSKRLAEKELAEKKSELDQWAEGAVG